MLVDTKDLVTKVSYLIGVRNSVLDQCFDEECHDLLQELRNDKEANIIRYLCKIRTTLMYRFKDTEYQMHNNLKNLDKLEWYNKDEIYKLEEWGVHLIKTNYHAKDYMLDLNQLINENIDKCHKLFYDWVNWAYIKDLFCIPKFRGKDVLINEFKKFMEFSAVYPFQMYIHWEKPGDFGSILYTDGKFLSLLYSWHNDYFEDPNLYKDAHSETKQNIYDFVGNSNKTVVAVDCENSDVYKLYSVLKNLKSEELSKIEKIVLYDDEHTSPGWDFLEKFTKIPVEHIEVDRVTDRKSLVDMMLAMGVSKEYYENNVDSFILVSSDSDFWAIIRSLPDANFIVMYQYYNIGEALKNALTQHDIYYCAIDDFCSGNTHEFRKAVLLDILRSYLPALLDWNGLELAKTIHQEARIEASEKEIDAFYKKYIKTLKISFDSQANPTIVITE